MTSNDALTLSSAGFWLAALGGLLMAVNAVRAFTGPAAFADYLGLPLASPNDAGLIKVYGLRAAFIALLVAALLVTGNAKALALLSASAVLMPVGDAVLSSVAGAPKRTVFRHVAIAVFLCVTAAVLWPRA